MRRIITITMTIAAKTPGLSFLPFFFPFLEVLVLDFTLLGLATASSATAEEVELVLTATTEVLRVVGAYCNIRVRSFRPFWRYKQELW